MTAQGQLLFLLDILRRNGIQNISVKSALIAVDLDHKLSVLDLDDPDDSLDIEIGIDKVHDRRQGIRAQVCPIDAVIPGHIKIIGLPYKQRRSRKRCRKCHTFRKLTGSFIISIDLHVGCSVVHHDDPAIVEGIQISCQLVRLDCAGLFYKRAILFGIRGDTLRGEDHNAVFSHFDRIDIVVVTRSCLIESDLPLFFSVQIHAAEFIDAGSILTILIRDLHGIKISRAFIGEGIIQCRRIGIGSDRQIETAVAKCRCRHILFINVYLVIDRFQITSINAKAQELILLKAVLLKAVIGGIHPIPFNGKDLQTVSSEIRIGKSNLRGAGDAVPDTDLGHGRPLAGRRGCGGISSVAA